MLCGLPLKALVLRPPGALPCHHSAVHYKGEQKTFSPEEISSMVLTKMREIAQVR